MKRAHWLCVAAFSLITTPVFAAMTGNINGFLGQKSLDSDDWDPVDKQSEMGVMADFGQKNWPVSIAVDLLYSWDDATVGGGDIDAAVLELDVGVRKVFDITGNALHPYVGGGLALVNADAEHPGGSDDDTGTGYWISGGAYWRFANNLNLGLDVRYTKADVDLFNNTVDAGGTHVGLLVGYHW